MYQSVFVIAEEKNECVIATEVSFYFHISSEHVPATLDTMSLTVINQQCKS